MEQQLIDQELQPAIEAAVSRLINQVYTSGLASVIREYSNGSKIIQIDTKISNTITSSPETGVKSSISTITLFTTVAEIYFQTQLRISSTYV
ncbi:MAG: hypothetical protein M3247_06530 [Thermoproteota archaeon]|nr:hypothetical protein [Thermoproteota archaeon]